MSCGGTWPSTGRATSRRSASWSSSADRRVVAAYEHHAADLDLARQRPRAVDGGGRAGASAAGVEHEDDRGVEAPRQVGRPRAVHALPAVEQRPHADDQREIHAIAPLVEQLVGHRGRVKRGVEGPRRAGGDVVDEAPEGQVEAQQDGASGALLAEPGEQRAGHEVERGAGFDPGQDEARHGHAYELSSILPRRARPTPGS